jgi:predicted metal-dependent phosphoesterase TrpH
MIDLHTHSVFSDGTMTPEKLIRYAETRGIEALALTDHDTVDGIPDFLSVQTDIALVPGLEISIAYDPGTFHLLGLFVDHKNEYMLKTLSRLQDARKRRNEKIIRSVSELLGRNVTEADISDENEGELGRPHIAKFLMKQGAVSSMNEAFDKYLGKGMPMYVDKERLDFHAAVDIIHEAGGAAILAHPFSLKLDGEKYYRGFIKYLKTLGLDGVEVWCTDTPADQYDTVLDIARENDLVVSGGSDFHGDNKLSVALGTGKGDLNIPFAVYEELKMRFGGSQR